MLHKTNKTKDTNQSPTVKVELIGKTDMQLWPDELARKYRANDVEVMSSGEAFADVEEHQTDDGRIGVQVYKIPFRDSESGDVKGVVGTYWNLTARQQTLE